MRFTPFDSLAAVAALAAITSSGATRRASAQTQQSWPPVMLTRWGQLAHDVYKELIEINTADSVGSTTVAANAVAKRFVDAGFPASD
ncbi:MAG: peptidase M20, partial [Gemmatimonadales bacterium]